MLLLGMLLFLGYYSSSAQQLNLQRTHPLTQQTISQPDVPDTLTIVAVMVEFQPDDNPLTTGDGTFDAENLSYLDNPDIKIDPLPHNQTYFKHHLEFAKNYFEEVSGNQITIEYRLLPDIYQLPENMEDYSPTGESFTNEKVAELAQDTWQVVEAQGGFSTSNLDPNKTTFAIFHAGIGRDIKLTGTTLNKTPQDIPSLFLDKSALSDLLEEPNFEGFEINNGSFRITNSVILPRSLSRRGEDIAGNEFVLQLSTNGLICASIGSYLGLPDLFNTETGDSGIGRFGLMDGESFFSYRGLFPPEPSAWEKIYLGWQTPFSITPSNDDPITLPAASYHQQNSIAKVELSASEYFLIENRHRDPNNNGVTLTFTQNDGSEHTKQFSNSSEAFVNQTDEFEETLISGVVTDVSNFEWSLPGGLDAAEDETAATSDDRLLNGGILIWHIDETVIQNQMGDRSVNDNPDRRGVDLEEADGAQDIGQAVNENFSSLARGTAFDFWWDGNDASVVTLEGDTLSLYENRFAPDTRPPNRSNSGAPTFWELYNFSDNQPEASFRIRPTITDDVQAVDLPVKNITASVFTNAQSDYFSAYPLALTLYSAQSDSFLIVPSQESAYAINLNDETDPIYDFQSPQIQQPFTGETLTLGEMPSSSQINISAWQWDGNNWNTQWNQQIMANNAFLSSVDNQTLLADFTEQRIDLNDGSLQSSLSDPRQQSAVLNGLFTSLTEDRLTLHPDRSSYSINKNGERHYTGTVKFSEDEHGFYYLSEDRLLTFDPDNFNEPKTITQNTAIEWPAITDINGDGSTDFIYVNKETGGLEARNINGAVLSHFPIEPPQNAQFIGTPLIATMDPSEKTVLFITTQDSLSMNIRAYTSDGEPIEGFPLFVGEVSERGNQPINPVMQGNTLYAVSHSGDMKAWQIGGIEQVLWAGRYGNTFTNKVSGTLASTGVEPPSSSSQILIDAETYNWPNPAHDFTNIRFQTSGPGTVNLKIITSGGSIVMDEQYQASGHAPEEHRISTQNWSSGLYFGMITAKVDGQESRKMLKIVVVQ